MYATIDKINSVIIATADKISTEHSTGCNYQAITISEPLAGVVRTGQPAPAGSGEMTVAWLAAPGQTASTFSGAAAQEPAQMRLLASWDWDILTVLQSSQDNCRDHLRFSPPRKPSLHHRDFSLWQIAPLQVGSPPI